MADVSMVDDNDDNWLYGDSNPDGPENEAEKLPNGDSTPAATEETPEKPADEAAAEDEEEKVDESHLNDEHFEDGEQPEEDQVDDGHENGDSDSDDSEDDVKVIIGDIKTSPTAPYSNLNIKRGGLIVQPNLDKQKQTGKFSVDEFESVGTINGVPAQEFNIDVLEDKPWRKPGADLTDYFNYGFNEDTWRAYCERQKRVRVQESGVGLGPLGGVGPPGGQQLRQLTPILNDNSKYTSMGVVNIRKAGPPPGTRRDGMLDDMMTSEPPPSLHDTLHNAIQVMTADRREYSRTKGFPDMSLPPPQGPEFFPEQPFYPPPYHQEENWGPEAGWTPGDIKELTPGPMNLGPPPMGHGPPGMGPMGLGPPNMGPPPPLMGRSPYGPPPPHLYLPRDMEHRDRDNRERDRDRERERERERDRDKDGDDTRKEDDRELELRDRDRDRGERDRSRSIKPDRHREKSHRRERSRSRSRRHKSRSRSPNSRHRSKKKSSHRKDKEDSE